ncbi:LOW QUALITY PROTEIN: oligopeptide ABC transporter, periplasmic oligopeptide-binding protein OppA [Geomicrobium sp. JCM 19039]|nr:LOW QUALITY PROTEIN: oligopeptide ABC transporter, periplasmic oligopeptide-binding protein OppA [Geomicrobium sp. JCM 19039]
MPAGDDEGEEAAADGGNIVIAVDSDVVDLDPHGSNDTSSTHVRTNIYEALVEHDADMELQPALAEDWEQIDEYTWEFYLTEDAEFTDGTPFNADAVIATLERVTDPEEASPRAFMYDMIEEVNALDDYTVEIVTEYPFAPLLAHLAHDGGGMISPTAIEQKRRETITWILIPVGTGPFELDNWSQGNEVVLTRNEDYWRGPVALDSATYRIVEEQSTRIAMLDQGEAHVVNSIEPANTSQVENSENGDIASVESLRMDYLGFNNTAEPFDDPDVRRALSMAVNKAEIVEGIFEGFGLEAIGPVNYQVFGFSDDIDPIEYDVDAAEELLADAGYEDGFEAELLVESGNSINMQMAEVIQDQLSEIGVSVSIQLIEWAALLDATDEANYEMVLLGWTTVTGDADYGTYALFHTDSHGPPGNNTFYTNEEVDQLLDDARRETDDDARIDMYREVAQHVNDDAPMLPIVHDEFRIGISHDVEGLFNCRTECMTFVKRRFPARRLADTRDESRV